MSLLTNYLFGLRNTFTESEDLTIHEDGAEDLLIEIERFLKRT